ncbi:phage tail protein [Sphingomonas hankookensis]|uniref:phage tail protein n=1 Tax=Sphingomonas hankookensis TaxID=563996 RepID=UPI003D303B1B
MGKGGSAKQQVNEYNVSIHFGVCAESDAITGIYVGEKLAWSGRLTSEGAISVQNEYLFGGPKKEGGVRGIAYYLPGSRTQVLPTGLAARRGLTSSTSPAYRGLSSIYFVGSMAPGLGFYWGATPYLQSVWITKERAPKGLDPAYAMIGNQVAGSFDGYTATIAGATATLTDGVLGNVGTHSASVSVSNTTGVETIVLDGTTVQIQPYVTDDDGDERPGLTIVIEGQEVDASATNRATVGGITVTVNGFNAGTRTWNVLITMGSPDGTDANPAHIVYECLTNGSWGMGATNALVDQANMETVGQVLYHEGFGMSLQWTRESAIEQFVGEVLDHIQAALYVDPDTGKLTLKLFRDDYNPTTLPLISPDNAVLDNFQRKLWGETVNEIIVTWTNPANEQEETVTQQDLGNITVQAATVSDSRNYYGLRNADLATRCAIRDVRQSSAPLASVDALLDRTQWNLKPGSVVRLTWPEYDIVNLVMRVVNIDYGKIGSPSITVSLLEDIFSLESAAFDSSPTTGFTSGAQPPTPMDHVRVITSPAYFASRFLSSADAAMLTYPDVLAAVLGATSNPDASFYETVGVTTLPNGTQAAEVRSTHGLLGYATLTTALVEEAFTTIPAFAPSTPGIGPNVAGFVFIGDVTERTMEIALIESFDENGWRLARGVLDTVPRAWPAGTGIWFYDIRNTFIDDERQSDGEAVNFKFLTVTSLGVLDVSAAPIQGATLTGRPYYPNRPANVAIAGQAFGTVDLSMTAPATVNITWANRNRTLEDGAVLRWTDATVTPEAGQTTTIKLTKTNDGSVITTIDGLTGTSYDLAATAFGSEFQADVTITAKRDGYESLMGVTRRVRIKPDPANPGSDPGTPTTPTDPGGYTPPETYPDPQEPPRYCVEETARVLLASPNRRSQGATILARDLEPGMWVWTRAEDGGWGAFEVTAVELVEEPVLRAAGYPRATKDHRFWTGAGWTTMGELGREDGHAIVAKIAVRDARTYVTVQSDGTLVLSHNIKQNQFEY